MIWDDINTQLDIKSLVVEAYVCTALTRLCGAETWILNKNLKVKRYTFKQWDLKRNFLIGNVSPDFTNAKVNRHMTHNQVPGIFEQGPSGHMDILL